MIKLIGSPSSPFVAKARLALIYLKIQFEEITVDTFHDPEELTRLNPLGKIPALIAEDGTVYYDSRVIMSYLNEISAHKLFPENPQARLKVEMLQALADGYGDVIVAQVYERRYRPEEKVHQPWLDKQAGKAKRALDYLENHLPDWKDGLNAGNLTLAIMLNFTELRFKGIWQPDHPKLVAWREEFMMLYPELQKHLPQE